MKYIATLCVACVVIGCGASTAPTPTSIERQPDKAIEPADTALIDAALVDSAPVDETPTEVPRVQVVAPPVLAEVVVPKPAQNLSPTPFIKAFLAESRRKGSRRTKDAITRVVDAPETYRFQLLITEVINPASKAPEFIQHDYRVDAEYFYPASAIKLFGSLAVLLDWTERKKTHRWLGIDDSVTYGGARWPQKDKTNEETGLVTLEHELKKLHLVSSNKAFNRVFNMTGQDRLHELLGPYFPSVRVYHRLSSNESYEECLLTPRIIVADGGSPSKRSKRLVIERRTSTGENAPRYPTVDEQAFTGFGSNRDSLRVGRAYIPMRSKMIVDEPMDFSRKNRTSFYDFQNALLALRYPKFTAKWPQPIDLKQKIDKRWWRALQEMMSIYPRFSKNPRYTKKSLSETRFKPLIRGLRAGGVKDADLVYFSKAGKAFGFHVENAFIAYGAGIGASGDPAMRRRKRPRIERALFITVGVYVNADGVLNNNRYEYDRTSVPLLNGVGRAVASYLKGRGGFSDVDLKALHKLGPVSAPKHSLHP